MTLAQLEERMKEADAEFEAFVATMPAQHWSKNDLAACRLGWEARKRAEANKRRSRH